jgi:hypothetical protein
MYVGLFLPRSHDHAIFLSYGRMRTPSLAYFRFFDHATIQPLTNLGSALSKVFF